MSGETTRDSGQNNDPQQIKHEISVVVNPDKRSLLDLYKASLTSDPSVSCTGRSVFDAFGKLIALNKTIFGIQIHCSEMHWPRETVNILATDTQT